MFMALSLFLFFSIIMILKIVFVLSPVVVCGNLIIGCKPYKLDYSNKTWGDGPYL